MSLLSGYTIIDLGTRLPCPLATKLLGDHGAHIIKIEDLTYGDPFEKLEYLIDDASFKNWYRALNKNKEIVKVDFKSPDAKKEIQKLILKANGIVIALPHKIRKTLGLTEEELEKLESKLSIITMASSHDHRPAHDLNILAEQNILSLHTVDMAENILHPPLLPIAGIAFAQTVATKMLGQVLTYTGSTPQQETIFMDDVVGQMFSPFLEGQGEQRKFLHNGKYPCYNLYKTKDNEFVAMAAIEEKFWNKFCELFKIENASPYDLNPNNTFKTLEKLFLGLNSKQIEETLGQHKICVNLVKG